jgi:hypothetical protein
MCAYQNALAGAWRRRLRCRFWQMLGVDLWRRIMELQSLLIFSFISLSLFHRAMGLDSTACKVQFVLASTSFQLIIMLHVMIGRDLDKILLFVVGE